jgi:fibronectin-binding autotransporter adhesin
MKRSNSFSLLPLKTICAALFAAIAPTLHAQLSSWTGAVSTDFSTAGNWFGNQVPSSFSELRFQVSATRKTITNNSGVGGAAFDQMSFESAPWNFTPGPVTASGTLAPPWLSLLRGGFLNYNSVLTLANGAKTISIGTGTSTSTASTTANFANIDLGTFLLTFDGSDALITTGNVTGGPATNTSLRVSGQTQLTIPTSKSVNTNSTLEVTVNAKLWIDGSSGTSTPVFANRGLVGGIGTIGNNLLTEAGFINPGYEGPNSVNRSGQPGTLTVNGNLVLANNGTTPTTLQFDVSRPAGDKLVVGGTITGPAAPSQSELTVQVQGRTPQIGQTFVLIEKTSAGPFGYAFKNKPENAVFNTPGSLINWRITYLGGNGNDCAVTVVSYDTPVTNTWTNANASNLFSVSQNWTSPLASASAANFFAFISTPPANTAGVICDIVANIYRIDFQGGGFTINPSTTTPPLIGLLGGINHLRTLGAASTFWNVPVILEGPQTFSNVSSGTQTIGGTVDTNGEQLVVFVQQDPLPANPSRPFTAFENQFLGSGAIIKRGTDTMEIVGNITQPSAYTGPFTVEAGVVRVSQVSTVLSPVFNAAINVGMTGAPAGTATLRIQQPNKMGTSSVLNLLPGGTVDMTQAQQVGRISFLGGTFAPTTSTIALNGGLLSNASGPSILDTGTITLAGSAVQDFETISDLTIRNAISVSRSATATARKTGAGALVFEGNTGLGTFNTTSGSVFFNGDGSSTNIAQPAASSPITIGGTGSLSTITGSSYTISPGFNGIGTLTLVGNFAPSSSGTLSAELGASTSDKLSAAVLSNYAGLNLSLSRTGAAPAPGTVFTLIEVGGTAVPTGTVRSSSGAIAQGSNVIVGGTTYTLSYTGGTGNDLTLTAAAAVPATTAPLAFSTFSLAPITTAAANGRRFTGTVNAGATYAGRTFQLQASNGLTTWTALGISVANASGAVSFSSVSDPNAQAGSRRFYRAVLQ